MLRFQSQYGARKARRQREKETTARATLKGRMKGRDGASVTVEVDSHPQTWAKRRLRTNKRPLRAANRNQGTSKHSQGAPETIVPKMVSRVKG